jgi:polyhydroxybutyrate depolymerase
VRIRHAAVLACLLACSKSSAPASAPDAGPDEDKVYGGDRPLQLFRVPSTYDKSKPAPLVMVLHGYGAGGIVQAAYFMLADIADEMGFFLIAPDGTIDSQGHRFWNATDTCCDLEGKHPDDVGYLMGLLKDISADYAIDPKRVYLVGHSNGGSMAFRLACDRADAFAAMVSLAGPFFSDPALCKPSAPVGVLHMQGTMDTDVPYDGGTIPEPDGGTLVFPNAGAVVATWAHLDGCAATADTSAPPIDLEMSIPGAETTITQYPACQANGAAELWTIAGAPHIPGNFAKDFPRRIWTFLDAHAKR